MGTIFTVFIKEIIDNIRDRRTLGVLPHVEGKFSGNKIEERSVLLGDLRVLVAGHEDD